MQRTVVPVSIVVTALNQEQAAAVHQTMQLTIDALGVTMDVYWRTPPTVEYRDNGCAVVRCRVAVAPPLYEKPRRVEIVTGTYIEEF